MSKLAISARCLLRPAAIALLLAALLAGTPPLRAETTPATGWTAREVGFAGPDGEQLGAYRDLGGGLWHELDREGRAVFAFTERRRDDWAIELVDPVRGVAIELDLGTQSVNYSGAGHDRTPLYRVLYVTAEPPTGETLTRVDFSLDGRLAAGSYVSAGNGQWVEVGAVGRVDRVFLEVERDSQGVYLREGRRGQRLRIDLATQTIYQLVEGGSPHPVSMILLAQ